MNDGHHVCDQCGHPWHDLTLMQHERMFCTVKCADLWMEAHPEEKAERDWQTNDDLIRGIVNRREPLARCPWCGVKSPDISGVMPGAVWIHPLRCAKNPGNQRN